MVRSGREETDEDGNKIMERSENTKSQIWVVPNGPIRLVFAPCGPNLVEPNNVYATIGRMGNEVIPSIFPKN